MAYNIADDDSVGRIDALLPNGKPKTPLEQAEAQIAEQALIEESEQRGKNQ